MHELYAALVTDKTRNDLITTDLICAIKAGRSPILLTERTSHLEEFATRLAGQVKHKSESCTRSGKLLEFLSPITITGGLKSTVS